MTDILRHPLLFNYSWNQEFIDDLGSGEFDVQNFYNYYTQWEGQSYPVGCMTVAVAQLLRFMEYPNIIPMPLDEDDYIYFGNAFGGGKKQEPILRVDRPYNWGLMDIHPDPAQYSRALAGVALPEEITQEHAELARDEIASLMHDVGVYMGTVYATGGSYPLGGDNIPYLLTKMHYPEYRHAQVKVFSDAPDLKSSMLSLAVSSSTGSRPLGVPQSVAAGAVRRTS